MATWPGVSTVVGGATGEKTAGVWQTLVSGSQVMGIFHEGRKYALLETSADRNMRALGVGTGSDQTVS